ncbi:glycosyl hydrolase [uncultured Acetobacteroides sp.]|uniref:glycoside hydrolase family 26 protein n=1 Tax=uncultured Acetobacteroides sp. TaxID=1760811 RepID=UPI0029F486E8|nr:glycosyl hydrolase [uncultured Acetobacteroides sp.]
MTKQNLRLLFLFLICLSLGCTKSSDSATSVKGEEPEWIEASPSATAVRNFLVDKNATDEVAALFYNLKAYAQNGVMIGQQDAFINRYSEQSNVFSDKSDIKLTTGQDPIVVGSDLIFATNYHNDGTSTSGWWYEQELLLKKQIKESYKRGLVVTICWHMNEPYHGDAFYVSEMDKVDPTLKNRAFVSILEGNENHEYYKKKLDKVAQILSSTTDDSGKPIPVILRLFHEFDGSWFWWGIPHYATPAQFIKNWQFTVKYLRDQKGLHNILYAFSPGDTFTSESAYTTCYPGDDYVDVVGFDNYEDYGAKGAAGVANVSSKLKIISDFAIAHKKVAALTEFGYSSANKSVSKLYTSYMLPAFTQSNAKIAYAMYWYNNQTSYYTATPYNPEPAKDFVDFASSPYIFLSGDTRNLYRFPSSINN